jgi:hypothetical protein
MEKRPSFGELVAKFRAQRWSREVVLAALLTIAAAVFIAAAMLRSDMPEPGTKPADGASTARVRQ